MAENSEPGKRANASPGSEPQRIDEDHVMAYVPSTTPPRRPHLARINPAWRPAPAPLGMLAPFFGGDDAAAPVAARPAPVRPLPMLETA